MKKLHYVPRLRRREIGCDFLQTLQPKKALTMDKRKYERFEIELPARLETIVSNRKQVYEFITKNISASGAFVSTNSSFSDGSRIKMSLKTQNKRLAELTGSQCLIECEGSVVRNTLKGVAICFNKDCQIMSLRGL